MGQRRHGVVVRFVVQSFADVTVVEKVVHYPNGIEPQLFRQRAKIDYCLGVFDTPVVGYGHAKFHFRTPVPAENRRRGGHSRLVREPQPTCGAPQSARTLTGGQAESYCPRLGRNGFSFSARDARLRVWIHTVPLPRNFITRPSPPAMSERMPPTLPIEYSTSSLKATR